MLLINILRIISDIKMKIESVPKRSMN